MACYVSQEGVMPVLIPDLPKPLLADLVKQLDGLVLQGGVDLAPESYGEQPILDGRWKGDPFRDAYEMELLRLFLEQGKPVFGICRGFQLMNAYFGGTLYQDIATQRPDCIQHRDAETYDRIHHGIRWKEDSYMATLHADEVSDRVNTIHHQAVKDLGNGLDAQAWCAEDGLVEAFIHSDHAPGKVMAVQWHPEFLHTLGERVISPAPLMNAFLDHARNN